MTQDELKALLDYNPETGVFTWRKRRGVSIKRPAGTQHPKGYVAVAVYGSKYLAHRLAFLWMTGNWPEHEVDHINGVRDDNRWANLREVNSSENKHNLGAPYCRNTTGFLGVTKHHRRFCAKISLDGKTRYLGLFATPEEAHAAYLRAKNELHPTHQRLRNNLRHRLTKLH